MHGEVAPTQADEATPGYSPVDALAPCDAHAPALCDARPPRSSPPERLSWLYVPLLHAAAGSLSEEAVRAWSSHPSLGDRWAALVSAMRHAPAADPQAVARLLSAVADVEAHEGQACSRSRHRPCERSDGFSRFGSAAARGRCFERKP